jgi:hypothetical protein
MGAGRGPTPRPLHRRARLVNQAGKRGKAYAARCELLGARSGELQHRLQVPRRRRCR